MFLLKIYIFILLTLSFSQIVTSIPTTSLNVEVFQEPPRIIHKLEDIYGCHGVPVQYWYNETYTGKEFNHLPSVPGCPRSIDGYPWIYFGNPPRCHLAGFRGPCAEDQKLMIEVGSPVGICACECLMEEQNIHLLQKQGPEDRYVFCSKYGGGSRGQLYDRVDKKCYNTFQEGTGACGIGEVITEWTSDSITCLPLCDQKSMDWFFLMEQGLCKTLPPVVVTSLSSVQRDDKCLDNERYSETLKKCINKSGPNKISG